MNCPGKYKLGLNVILPTEKPQKCKSDIQRCYWKQVLLNFEKVIKIITCETNSYDHNKLIQNIDLSWESVKCGQISIYLFKLKKNHTMKDIKTQKLFYSKLAGMNI